VNFKEVRSNVDFATVLDHYGIDLKAKGEQLQGFCPLPGHSGKKKSPSFSLNLTKGIFQCFGCGAKGNVLDFTALMEGLDPNQGGDIRKAALFLQERFLLASNSDPRQPPPSPVPTPAQQEETTPGDSIVVNAPLDFELKTLDSIHPYPRGRGLSEETIEAFGLGYASRGLMKGRLCIPLHDSAGRLIGYAGRMVEETAIGEDAPKYLLPGRRERDGTMYQFSKAEFLFNGFRIPGPVRNLVVVEGFFGCMWLHQHGYQAVAVMGATCSERQAALIVHLVQKGGVVWAMPDGDEAGKRLAAELFFLVGKEVQMRYVDLRGRDPETVPAEELREMIA
jgi:DNA primase